MTAPFDLSLMVWRGADTAPGGETTKGRRHAAKRERPPHSGVQAPLRTGVTKKPRATTGANLRNGHERTEPGTAKLSRHRHVATLQFIAPASKTFFVKDSG